MRTSTLTTSCAALCAVLAVTSVASAEQMKLRPGQWEIVTTVRVPRLHKDISTQTNQICITPEEANGGVAPVSQKGDCLLTNVKTTKTTYSADSVCKNGATVTKSHLEYVSQDEEHYTGTSMFPNGAGPGMDFVAVMDAKFVAPVCTKK